MHFSTTLFACLAAFSSQTYAASLPLEKRTLTGTVTLFAERDCDPGLGGLLGLGVNTIEVEENVCYDDSRLELGLLGADSFQSFILERHGDGTDPADTRDPAPMYDLVALGYPAKDACKTRNTAGFTAIGSLKSNEQRSVCVNVKKGKKATVFTFFRFKY